jgi:hypothetical protein
MPAESRSVILTQLIADDPEYRDYLKRVVQTALNHQLTQAFLTERYQHYQNVATELQIPASRLPAPPASVPAAAPEFLQAHHGAVVEQPTLSARHRRGAIWRRAVD